MLLQRIATGLIFSAMQVYFLSNTVKEYGGDSAFLGRTLMLSTGFLLLMVIMWPVAGTLASMYYLFAYVMMYSFLVIMYITKEPILALFPVFFVIMAVGISVKRSRVDEGAVPSFVALYMFVLVAMFYSDDTRVNSLIDSIWVRPGIDSTLLPEGYLSGDGTVLVSPLFIATVIAVFTYAYVGFAYRNRDIAVVNWMTS